MEKQIDSLPYGTQRFGDHNLAPDPPIQLGVLRSVVSFVSFEIPPDDLDRGMDGSFRQGYDASMFRTRQYRIFRNGEEIAIETGKSARGAICSFVDKQVQQKIESDGWSAKEFLKYSLSAQAVTRRIHKPSVSKFQFSLRRTFFFSFWFCVFSATLAKEFYALFGLIFLSPLVFRWCRSNTH